MSAAAPDPSVVVIPTAPDFFIVAMGLAGGLALFLLGMEHMASGLKAVAGDRMKVLLARLTTNRILGALTGAFTTAVIQSSSVTTVLVVGFVTAGLMTLTQSVGVIMGANIGTTVTAQIVAFKVTEFALLLVAVGFALTFAGRHERLRHYGGLILGLGLVFFGMDVMGDAVAPLRQHRPFIDALGGLDNTALAIVAGAAFTALVQSSSATTAVVIMLAAQGLIALPVGIAIALGANIGTCVTALLAAIGKPREAVRAAVVHVLFNVAGVALWIGFIDQLAAAAAWLSPAAPDLSGLDRLAAETPRQIANAHTLFNVLNTLVFIGFTGPIARLVVRLVPERPAPEAVLVEPKYLHDDLLGTPTLALNAARMELGELGRRAGDMLAAILPAVLSGSPQSLKDVERMDVAIDLLHGQIIDFLRRLGLGNLTAAEAHEMVNLMTIANNLENIGDIIETDLVTVGRRRIDERVFVSKATQRVIGDVHGAVAQALDTAVQAAVSGDEATARRVVAMKSRVNRLADEAVAHGARRLIARAPERTRTYTREMEVIERLKRVYYFAKRIAKAVEPHAEAE